jgi:hypothetical protein
MTDHQYAEKTKAARLVAEMLGLPALRGSARQVDWALCIRDEKLQQIAYVRANVIKLGQLHGQSDDQIDADLARVGAAVEDLARRWDLASWWIDRRGADLALLLVDSGLVRWQT